jgi:phage shock protein PspC (stress-responsive transcriptional regulator)
MQPFFGKGVKDNDNNWRYKMSEKQLVRSQDDKMLFGVCGGLAEYLNIDPVLVRLFFVLLALSTGWGFIVYILLAILMPEVKPVAKANSFDEEEIIIKNAS